MKPVAYRPDVCPFCGHVPVKEWGDIDLAVRHCHCCGRTWARIPDEHLLRFADSRG